MRRTTVRRWLPAAITLLFLPACSPTPGADVSAVPTQAPVGNVIVNLDGRPFQLHVPATYRPTTKAPLVVLLHGYAASADIQEAYFKLTAESDRRGFLYAMPDGTTNPQGKRFWNATEACCDLYGSGVDDSAYLHRLLDAVRSKYSVDPARVYLVGHSNGGFMAYRMACDHAADLTAIVSLAGAATIDPAQCRPDRPVSVLQIHGTDDRTILFEGNPDGRQAYPSVATTLATWRRLDSCGERADRSGVLIDLDSNLPGPDTTVTTYADGCLGGTRVELWTIDKGRHVPALTANFAPAILDFLYGQVSPSA